MSKLALHVPLEAKPGKEAAVREFCKTLRDLCGFRYVSEAVILDPGKEKVRYYLVFATNHHKGIEVFKNAEMKAARLQDYVRHQTQIQKSGQDELPLGDGPPTSPISLRLRDLYYVKAKKKFIETLRKAPTAEGVSYRNLYCETMAFPLVTPADLDQWLRELWSKIEIRFSGSLNRKKLSPNVDDRVVVIDQGSIGLEVH